MNFTMADVMWADELPGGQPVRTDAGVVFLETDSPARDAPHPARKSAGEGTPDHIEDFRNRGVPPGRVPDLIRDGFTKGIVMGGKPALAG